MRKYSDALILILLMGLMGALLLGHMMRTSRTTLQSTNHPAAYFTCFSHVRFPEGTVIVRQQELKALTVHDFWLKAEMPKNQLDTFIKDLPMSYPRGDSFEKGQTSRTDKLYTTKRYMSSFLPDWWKTEDAKDYIAIHLPANYGEILIALDHPQKAEIYQHWAH